MADIKSKLIKGSDTILPVISTEEVNEGVRSYSGFTKEQEAYIRQLIDSVARVEMVTATSALQNLTTADTYSEVIWTGGQVAGQLGLFGRRNYNVPSDYPDDRYTSYNIFPFVRSTGATTNIIYHNKANIGYIQGILSCVFINDRTGSNEFHLMWEYRNSNDTVIATDEAVGFCGTGERVTISIPFGYSTEDQDGYFKAYVKDKYGQARAFRFSANFFGSPKPLCLYDNIQ